MSLTVAVTVEQSWHRVPGGTARSILELLRALVLRSDVVPVGVAARHARPAPLDWRVPHGVDVAQLPLPRHLLYETWHLPLAPFPKVERATGPVDVVHATAVAYPRTSAPLVVTVHDLAFLRDPLLATRHGHRFFRRGMELARQGAAAVAVPSEATRQDCLAEGFPAERVRVIPWGVRPEALDGATVATVQATYGATAPYVLFVGTIEPRKNLPVLLDAFARASTSATLVLAGADGWNEDLAAARQRLGSRLRVLGFVPRYDLLALLSGASLFCYPSRWEGFGMPVLEAMAQGCPVITSATTATAEVAGDAAVLVDPDDVEGLAAAIEGLLADPHEADRLRARGRARASGFTWDATAAAYAALYHEVAR